MNWGSLVTLLCLENGFPDSCGPDNFDWPVITQLNIQETEVNRLYETSDYTIIYSTRSSEHFLTPSTCKLGEHPSTQTSWGISCPTSHNKARRHGARMGDICRRLRCVFVYFIEDFDTFASMKEAQNNMYDGVVYLIVFPLFGLYIKGGCVCRIWSDKTFANFWRPGSRKLRTSAGKFRLEQSISTCCIINIGLF